MTNNITIIRGIEELECVSNECKNTFYGVFYIVEFGNNIKIGSTSNPQKRMQQLQTFAAYAQETIGRVAISKIHTNYKSNEYAIHKIFDSYRLAGTELFCFDFIKAVKKIQDLEILFEDKNEELNGIAQNKANSLIECIKHSYSADSESIISAAELINENHNLKIKNKMLSDSYWEYMNAFQNTLSEKDWLYKIEMNPNIYVSAEDIAMDYGFEKCVIYDLMVDSNIIDVNASIGYKFVDENAFMGRVSSYGEIELNNFGCLRLYNILKAEFYPPILPLIERETLQND